MRKTKFICYKCHVPLWKTPSITPKNALLCGNCLQIYSYRRIQTAVKHKKVLAKRGDYPSATPNGYHPKTVQNLHLLQDSVFNKCEKIEEYKCPICTTNSIRETWDGRLICVNCLYVINNWTRIPDHVIDNVKMLKSTGFSISDVAYHLTLSIDTVKYIMKKYK